MTTALGHSYPRSNVLSAVGGVDLDFDVIGGDIGKRFARLIRAEELW
jgi:hypothetical protein